MGSDECLMVTQEDSLVGLGSLCESAVLQDDIGKQPNVNNHIKKLRRTLHATEHRVPDYSTGYC